MLFALLLPVFVSTVLAVASAPSAPLPCGYFDLMNEVAQRGSFVGAPRARDMASFPLLLWPMESPLNAGTMLGNYVDDDSTAAIHDYMGLESAGDGHAGTDFGIHDFRAMDRGEEVRAAAAGTVAWKQDGKADRSIGPPWPDDGNNIAIDHGDGTFAYYLHLRKNSLTIDLGEPVVAGQLLGFAGSSGYSFGPHLHFEVGQYAPAWTKRDPWQGSYNTLPSLWVSQAAYIGDDLAIVHAAGVLTKTQPGGSWTGIPYAMLIEGFVPPAVVGADELEMGIWVLFQGNPGGSFRMELRRPNGTLFYGNTFPIGFKAFPQTGIFAFSWNGQVPPADYGAWQLQVLVDGAPVVTKPVAVGATTRYAPRFRPAGRSYRIDGSVQRDTLRVDMLGGPATFSLLGAPSFVTLESDSVLRLAGTSTQPNRSVFFQAIAVNPAAERDTMWLHVVDPSKPVGGTTSAPVPVIRGTGLILAPISPNPIQGQATIRYTAPEGMSAVVTIVDVLGRNVRRFTDAGAERTQRSVVWDGRTEDGRPLPAGVYFVRLQCGHDVVGQKAALIR